MELSKSINLQTYDDSEKQKTSETRGFFDVQKYSSLYCTKNCWFIISQYKRHSDSVKCPLKWCLLELMLQSKRTIDIVLFSFTHCCIPQGLQQLMGLQSVLSKLCRLVHGKVSLLQSFEILQDFFLQENSSIISTVNQKRTLA